MFFTLKITGYVNMAPPNVSSEVLMRGTQDRQASMLALFSIEARIPSDHPLRRIKAMADQELWELSKVFDRMYSNVGRPSVAPEKILKSLLLMALYSVRSERQLCEQMGYNLLFRWFLDMELEEESFDATVFSKNRDRLMEHEVGRLFFDAVVRQAREAKLMSDDHFTVDGTLIEAWASLKSFRPKGKIDRGTKIREIRATVRWTFTVSSAVTTPKSRRPTPRACWPARGRAKRPSCVTGRMR